jgi:DNA primase
MKTFEKRDVVDILTELGVDLVEKGDGEKPYLEAFCPFHDNTRTPAFYVYPLIQRWVCYGCSPEGGDVIDFVRRKFGCNFEEAKKICCDELTPETALANHIKTQDLTNAVDTRLFAVRMHKMFEHMDYAHVVQVHRQIDRLIAADRWIEVDKVLRRYNV